MSWITLTIADKFATPGHQVIVAKHLIGKVVDRSATPDFAAGSTVQLLTIGEVYVKETAAEVLAKLSIGVTPD